MELRRFDDPDTIEDMAGYLTGCPTPLMVSALRRATNSFLRDTGALRIAAWPTTTSSKISTYPLDLDRDYVATSLHKLTLNGRELTLPAMAQLAAGELVVSGALPDKGTLVATVDCVLSDEVEGAPEWLVAAWGSPIKHKALSSLLERPGCNWTDTTLAAAYAAKYGRGVLQARNSMLLAGTNGNIRVKPQLF